MSTPWEDSHYTPQDFLGWALSSGWRPSRLPVGVVHTFQASVTRYLENSPDRFERNTELTISNATTFMTAGEKSPVLIACLNPGAASAATQLEHLRFLGDTTRYVAVVGTAGALVPGYQFGDTTVVTSALRDELLSNRYLAPARVVDASPRLSDALVERLGGEARRVRTWSVALPYRQTTAELAAARSDGAETVEMEIATVFAAAAALEMHASAAVVVSDMARVDDWEVDWSDVAEPLNRAVEAAVDAIRAAAIADGA